jgi:beta-lactam-binding protein with PASTA domain
MTDAQSVTARFARACVVPKVAGKKLSPAKRLIRRNTCRVGSIRRAHSTKVRKGRVISQRPRAGSRHPAGFVVHLVVSSGRKR